MAAFLRTVKKSKKPPIKIIHNPKIRTNVPAGMASAGPPLGSMLGCVSMIFDCYFSVAKYFNERKKKINKNLKWVPIAWL